MWEMVIIRNRSDEKKGRSTKWRKEQGWVGKRRRGRGRTGPAQGCWKNGTGGTNGGPLTRSPNPRLPRLLCNTVCLEIFVFISLCCSLTFIGGRRCHDSYLLCCMSNCRRHRQ